MRAEEDLVVAADVGGVDGSRGGVREWPYVCKKTPQKLVVAGLHSALRGRESALLFQKGRTLRTLLQERNVGGCFTATWPMVASGIFRSVYDLRADVRETVADGVAWMSVAHGIPYAIRDGHLRMVEWLLRHAGLQSQLHKTWWQPGRSNAFNWLSPSFAFVDACIRRDWRYGVELALRDAHQACHISPVDVARQFVVAAAHAGQPTTSLQWMERFEQDMFPRAHKRRQTTLAFAPGDIPALLSSSCVLDFVTDRATLGTLRWLQKRGAMASSDGWALAAAAGRLDVLQLLSATAVHKTDSLCFNILTRVALRAAAGNGHLRVCEWLWDRWPADCSAALPDAQGRATALRDADDALKMLRWLQARTSSSSSRRWTLHTNAAQIAARNGHTTVLELLLAQGAPTSTVAATGAAAGGHLTCLEVLCAAACELRDRSVLSAAAAGGHLHCMRWLMENRLTATENSGAIKAAMNAAAASGSLQSLEWMHDNIDSVPPYHNILQQAALSRSLPVVEYVLRNHGLPQENHAMLIAANRGDIRLVNLLHAWGMEYSSNALAAAACCSYADIVRLIAMDRPDTVTRIVFESASPRMKRILWRLHHARARQYLIGMHHWTLITSPRRWILCGLLVVICTAIFAAGLSWAIIAV